MAGCLQGGKAKQEKFEFSGWSRTLLLGNVPQCVPDKKVELDRAI